MACDGMRAAKECYADGRADVNRYLSNHLLIGWDTFLRTCDKVAPQKQRRLPHRRLPENDQTKAIEDQTLAIKV